VRIILTKVSLLKFLFKSKNFYLCIISKLIILSDLLKYISTDSIFSVCVHTGIELSEFIPSTNSFHSSHILNGLSSIYIFVALIFELSSTLNLRLKNWSLYIEILSFSGFVIIIFGQKISFPYIFTSLVSSRAKYTLSIALIVSLYTHSYHQGGIIISPIKVHDF